MSANRIVASHDDRRRLDAAVKACIKRNPRCRAAQIERDPDVVKALGRMPLGKSDSRWLDNSLQRLRKTGEIECPSGGYWSVKAVRS